MKEWTKEKKEKVEGRLKLDLRVRSNGFFLQDEEKEIGTNAC